MSFNQIYDIPPYDTPIDPYKDVKFNQVRSKFARIIDGTIGNIDAVNISTNNINTATINGQPYSPLTPGANGQLFKTIAGVPAWQYFQLGDFSNSLGPADSVLTTNSLTTTAAWSKDLKLDSIDIANSDGIKLNGVSPAPSQFLGANGLGALSWQSIPASFGRSIYYCFASQDINFAINTTLAYTSGYDNLVGQISQTAPSNFTCLVAGVYVIQANVSVIPSTSENEISITVNGPPISYGFINLASSFTQVFTIIPLGVGDIIQILSTRVGLDATPKLNLANTFSSPLSFTRLA